MGRGVALGVILLAGLGSAAPATVVTLKVTGPDDEARQLEASVRELLGRLGLKLGGEGAVLAEASVRLGEADCEVAVIDAKGELVASRLLRRRENAQLTLEALAYIIQSTMEALVDLARNPIQAADAGSPVPITSPPVVTAPAFKTPPAQTPSPIAFELGVQVSGRAFGNQELFVPGVGLVSSLRLAPESRWAPRLSLLVGYNMPFDGKSSLMSITTQTLSVRLLPGLRLIGDEHWSLELQAGLGFDTFFVSGTSPTLSVYTHDRADFSPVLTALLAVHHRLTPATDVFLTVSGDLDLLPHRYVAIEPATQHVLYDAWRLRPAVALGFTFELVGKGAR